MGNTENFITILNIALVIIICAMIVLGGVLIFIILKSKNKKPKNEESKTIKDSNNKGTSSKNQNIESMSKFLEFDEIIDNMIVRKEGKQYIMVIDCKGVNFDLLGEEEKIAVENGFVQFLNTLKTPVQLYVQTRTLNLKDTVDKYKSKVLEVAMEIDKLDLQLEKEKQKGNEKVVKRIEFDRRRKLNVLEYGTDIAEYVSRMSQNRNVLRQNTYAIISYYTAEFGGEIENYSKEEINNIAFSELYTRAQTLIRGLAAAGVSGRVLDSEEIMELLYVAYNRDDSEIFNLDKAINAEYDSLYSTAKDVLEKKKELLDKRIDEQASDLAVVSIKRADRIRKIRRVHQDEIKQRAQEYIDEFKLEMEQDLYEEAKNQVDKTDFVKQEKVEQAKQRKAKAKKNELSAGENDVQPAKRKLTPEQAKLRQQKLRQAKANKK